MKRVSFGVLLLLLWMLQACVGNTKNSRAVSTDSISTTDSLKAVKDTTRKTTVAADSGDIKFLNDVSRACTTAIALGKIAQQKGKNKRVKNFGVMMEKDLFKADKKLMLLAKSKNIVLPLEPGAENQKLIDSLSAKSGEALDKAYVNIVIEEHLKYIKEFENASANGSDPDIKTFANKTLPSLKNHLDAINTINASMK